MQLLIFLFIIIAVTSCGDNFGKYERYIENNTNDTIKVIFKDHTAIINTIDTIKVIPHSKLLFFESTHRMLGNPGCGSQIKPNEVKVEISENKTLLKDISLDNNWDCEYNEQKSYSKMTFTINISDVK